MSMPPPSKVQRTSELPTLEALLVSIDVAPRAEKLELTHTVNALHERAKLDGLADSEPYLKLAILVAFRRRHHLKAMASGTGAGERCVLRTVLQCVARTHAHLVQAVLPLVPEYGSWRDVRLIGDDAHADCVALGVEPAQVETAVSSSKPEQEEGPGGGSARVFGAVAALFAQQLQRDLAAARLPIPGISADEVVAAGESLSNAAKYAPSASRHRGALKTRRYQASHKQLLNPDSTSEDLPASSAEAPGRRGRRGRRGDRRLRDRPSPEEAAAAAMVRESGHAAQKAMVKQLAAHLGLPASRAEAALRQQVVAPLNLRLTEQGYQVERLLCERRYADIKFRRAPKGSLTKYGDAIRKDPKAARRWAAIAEVSASAVPDLDDLFAFADTFMDLRRGGGDAEAFLMQRRSVSKAVDSAVAERARLTARASALLDQVKEESSSESKEGKSVTSEVLSASIINDLRANVPCLPLVDFTSIPSTRDGVALLLAAFVCLRFQERLGLLPKPASLVVALPGGRGVVVAVPSAPVDATADDPTTTTEAAAAASDAPTDAAADEMKTEPASSTVDGDDFALLVEEVERAVAAAGGMGHDATPLDAEMLAQAGRALLESSSAVAGPGGAQETSADVMLLCSAFHAANDKAAFEATIAQLQRPSTGAEATENGGSGTGGRVLRALLVNRCKATSRSDAEGGVPLQARTGLRPRPENPKDVTVDVCFMLDCTGSMGSWMAAAKEHLSGIMQGLRDDAGVGNVRVAFVGYRDYRDHDRVVVADFAPLKDCARVVDVIGQQCASGGADEPEDVACGLRACCDLAWESHVRFVVHVADATGHGLTSSLSYSSDDYPEGTPDQTESTAETIARLSDAKPGNPGADLLFCKLNDRTRELEDLYATVYGANGGTGTLPILEGSRAFKDAVLGCLTDSLLGLMVAADTAAVQTFDGRTLSARLNCLNASFKESLQTAGEALLNAHTASSPNAPAAETTAAVAEEGAEGGGGEVLSAAGAGTEAELKAEVGGGGGGEESSAAGAAGTEVEERALPAAPPVARGDGQRLMAELEGEDLVPLRIALGLPASAGAFTGGGLAERAASSLLDSGVTLANLTELGYPKPIADIFREVGAKRVKRVA